MSGLLLLAGGVVVLCALGVCWVGLRVGREALLTLREVGQPLVPEDDLWERSSEVVSRIEDVAQRSRGPTPADDPPR